MAGSQSFRADLPGHAQQRLKLHIGVAVGAGDGVRPARYCSTNGRTTRCFKLFFEIDDVVREIQMLRDALGVVDVVERAAAVLRRSIALQFGQAPLIPELHGQADDRVALLLEQAATVEESTPPDMATATRPAWIRRAAGRESNWNSGIASSSIVREISFAVKASKYFPRKAACEGSQIGRWQARNVDDCDHDRALTVLR